jgi:deoxyadenosine/deoxycytidine kinase
MYIARSSQRRVYQASEESEQSKEKAMQSQLPVDGLPIRIISIEGGIGVGKSTVMAHLRKAMPELHFIDEPVNLWEEAGLLKAMYDGSIPPSTFQIAALSTRMAPLLKAAREGHRVIVTERCPWSDLQVFTKANLPEDSMELAAYVMAYDALMTAMPPYITLWNIYLTAKVYTLVERIGIRNRLSESTACEAAKASRRSYLDKLQERHDAFYNSTAADLGVANYFSTCISSELPSQQVCTTVEACVSRITRSSSTAN